MSRSELKIAQLEVFLFAFLDWKSVVQVDYFFKPVSGNLVIDMCEPLIMGTCGRGPLGAGSASGVCQSKVIKSYQLESDAS